MNTAVSTVAPRPHPAPSGSETGCGRYLLDPDGVDATGPRAALDTRLGRRVLIQSGTRATPATRLAARLVRVDHPGLGPLLDAGDDPRPDGTWTSWAVFPAWDWRPLATLDATWADLDLPTVAGVAAWLTATVVVTQNAVGATVAPGSSDVVVDPALFAGGTDDADGCPVRWLPSLATTGADTAALLAPLAAGRSRREHRALSTAFALLATPPGRPRALRHLAALAGVDPHRLGLTPHAPHHAGPTAGRRPTGRRSPVGLAPTSTTRTDVPCVSVQASS